VNENGGENGGENGKQNEGFAIFLLMRSGSRGRSPSIRQSRAVSTSGGRASSRACERPREPAEQEHRHPFSAFPPSCPA